MQNAIILFVVIQITAIIFNVGILFAYLKRCTEPNHHTIKQDRQKMFLSILFGLWGVLTLPGIYIATEFPKFGLEYWKIRFIFVDNKIHRKPEGECVDMWETE